MSPKKNRHGMLDDLPASGAAATEAQLPDTRDAAAAPADVGLLSLVPDTMEQRPESAQRRSVCSTADLRRLMYDKDTTPDIEALSNTYAREVLYWSNALAANDWRRGPLRNEFATNSLIAEACVKSWPTALVEAIEARGRATVVVTLK